MQHTVSTRERGASRRHVRGNNKTPLVQLYDWEIKAWGKRANSGEVHIAFPTAYNRGLRTWKNGGLRKRC
jgi:hypothetical protein